MIESSPGEILEAVKGRFVKVELTPRERIKGVSIDSRTIQKGNLFIAIQGEKHDGHKFIAQAFENGAVLGVAEENKVIEPSSADMPVIAVKDSRNALYDLASWYRKRFDLPTIAITGSNGKTTVKEMATAVLSEKYEVLKTPKSYNNLIGIPLTLFEIEPKTEVLVLELGMSSQGEIAKLTKLTQPDWGVITNIGPAHLQFMKSLENIAKAKFELLDNMGRDKTSVLNADDKYLSKRMNKEKRRTLAFAVENPADFRASSVKLDSNGYPSFRVNNKTDINLGVLGRHNIYNALVAFALGKEFGISENLIKKSLEDYKPAHLRMEITRLKGINLVNDAYNANPTSMRYALETLAHMKTQGSRIAVLGDMLELGEKSKQLHARIGRKAAKLDIDYLLLKGDFSKAIADAAGQKGLDQDRIMIFENNSQISSWLLDNLKAGDTVLFKASRRMGFEKIVEDLKNLLERQN